MASGAGGSGFSTAAKRGGGAGGPGWRGPWREGGARRHNDANMLAMGAGMVGPNLAERIVEVFLTTPFEGGRHQRRVDLIHAIEKESSAN